MFQAKGVKDYLEVLESSYGVPCGADRFRPHLEFLQGMDRDRHLNPDSAQLRSAISGLRAAAMSLNDQLTQRFFNVGHAPAWAPLGL